MAFLKTEAPVGGRQLSGALVQLEVSGAQVISGPAGLSGALMLRELVQRGSYW